MSSEFVAKGWCVACLWQALCFWFGPCVFGLLVYFFWRGLASISFIGSTSATVEAAFGDTSQCLLGSSARRHVKVPWGVAWFQLPFAAQTHTNTYICRILYFCVFSILLSLTSDQRYTHLASDWHCTWEVWTTDLCDGAAAVRSAAPCLKGSWDDANSQNSTNTKGYWTDHESGLFGSFPTPRSQPNTSQTSAEFRGKWSLVNGNMYRLLILDILINRVYLFCALFTNSLTWSNRGIFENLLTIELILIASFSLEFL